MGFWGKLFGTWFGTSTRGPRLTPIFPDTPRTYDPPGFAAPPAPIDPETPPTNPPPYRVFTHDFDRVVTADELGDVLGQDYQLERDSLRQPDQTIYDLHPDWRQAVELAATETFVRLRKTARAAVRRDTAVTLLIDLSGSMKGELIRNVAISVDIALNLILKLGVSAEILGFTTSSWQGGQSRKAWVKAGKPSEPGRLCDLLHIVYRSGDGPDVWPMSDLLCSTLLKENVDGEALAWAADRLRALPQRRKVLIVVSDGAPVDDSTLASNDSWILERHLRETIRDIDAAGDVHLAAFGIGHDVRRYYHSQAAYRSNLHEVGSGLIELLADVVEEAFAADRRRRLS